VWELVKAITPRINYGDILSHPQAFTNLLEGLSEVQVQVLFRNIYPPHVDEKYLKPFNEFFAKNT